MNLTEAFEEYINTTPGFITTSQKDAFIKGYLKRDSMEEYEVIGWPEIQTYMELDGFTENSALIDVNDNIGIGNSTYLVAVKWLKSI